MVVQFACDQFTNNCASSLTDRLAVVVIISAIYKSLEMTTWVVCW